MPPKTVEARTPLYAPQEERAMPGVAESILSALGFGGEQVAAAGAAPLFYRESPDQIIEEAARGLRGGGRLSPDEYLKMRIPARSYPASATPAMEKVFAEQAVERTAQRTADLAATRRVEGLLAGTRTAAPAAARGGLGLAARQLTRGNAITAALTGLMGPLSSEAGRAYARTAANPTAQTSPVITPGGAFQPEGSVFRDPSVQTQGDVESLLSEMARERARSQAADNLYDVEQALEVEKYLRQGAPYVAIADDFEPLEVYP